MKQKTYEYTRDEIADIAGVGVDAVRMEERKGTFDTLLGLSCWIVGKRLLGEAVLAKVMTADDVHFEPPEEYA